MRSLCFALGILLSLTGYAAEPGSIYLGNLVIQAPLPPDTYTLPSGATTVETAAELEAELNDASAGDIIVADGTYVPTSGNYFTNDEGDRIYAATLGGAVFENGIYITASDAIIRGLAFDIDDAGDEAALSGGGSIRIANGAEDVQILDTTFEGNNVAFTGIYATEPEGLVIRRVRITNFERYGIIQQRVGQVREVPVTRSIISDAFISQVVDDEDPGSQSGTAEACIWLGHTSFATRLWVDNCGWMGLFVGFWAHSSYITHIVSLNNYSRHGIYFERFAHGLYLSKFWVGGNIENGITIEYAASNGRATSMFSVIEQGLIQSTKFGVVKDVASLGTTVRYVRFEGQRYCAINNYQGTFPNGDMWDLTGNNYDAIETGASETCTAAVNTFRD